MSVHESLKQGILDQCTSLEECNCTTLCNEVVHRCIKKMDPSRSIAFLLLAEELRVGEVLRSLMDQENFYALRCAVVNAHQTKSRFV